MAVESLPFTANAQIVAPLEGDAIMGVVYTGFTAVTVYDGVDNTGNVLLAGGAGPQSILSNFPIDARRGVYVVVAGAGKGSILA